MRRRLTTGTASISAWVPSRVKPASPPVPQTSAPIHSDGPTSTTPAKSRPGMRGGVVCLIAPATFLTSLGLIEAAITRTTAVFACAIGSGTFTALRAEGSPKASNRIARTDLLLRVIIGRASLALSVSGGLSQHSTEGEEPPSTPSPKSRASLTLLCAALSPQPAAASSAILAIGRSDRSVKRNTVRGDISSINLNPSPQSSIVHRSIKATCLFHKTKPSYDCRAVAAWIEAQI